MIVAHAFSLWTWLGHFTGTSDEAGPGYGFFSPGIGSDIGEAAILIAIIHWYRTHTCHVDSPKFCWRPGLHTVDGTPYKVCKRHHPTVPDQVTAKHIAAAHQTANQPTEGCP